MAIMCRLGRQSERVQMAMVRRYTEIVYVIQLCFSVLLVNNMRRQPPHVLIDSGPGPLISTSFNDPSNIITAVDIEQFQNPDDILGKQFMLSHIDDVDYYEITGYHKRRNGIVQYEVLWEDSVESIDVDADEMMRMLKDSHYVSSAR